MKAADTHSTFTTRPGPGIRENALNRMCHSLEMPENRKRFKAFPEAYCHSYGLNRDETHAVTDLDVLRMLQLGGHIQRLALLTSIYGMDVLEIGAEQNGLEGDEFRSLLQTEGYLATH
jgi:protocatechuate 4,5-dioxygenase, alpha chain